MNTVALALSLSGNFEPGPAILGGLVGAVAMLMVMYGGRAMGMTSMDLLRTLGTMVNPKASDSTARLSGLVVHLMMGTGFGLAHASLLHLAGPTTEGAALGLGALFGLAHGAMTLVAMPVMLSRAHPLVAAGDIPRPGVAMTGFGTMTPVGMLMAHAVFAVVAGAVYTGLVG